MKTLNKEKIDQINRPLLGRGLRALASRPVGTLNLVNTAKTVAEKTEHICAPNACRKSGTIAL